MISLANTTKLYFLILLFISSCLIFYRFPDIPHNLSFDEVEFAKLAISLDNKPYIAYSTQATGHSTLYFYLLLLSLKLFGITNFALRLPAAIFGVMSVVLLFSILKKSIKEPISRLNLSIDFISFSIALIFLTLHWYYNFTRFAFEATFLLFLELIAIYFLLKFMQEKKYIWIIFCGIFSGLSYLSYTPGRIFFLLPTIVLISCFTQKKKLTKILALVLFILSVFFLTAPLNNYFLTSPDIRISQLSYWHDHSLNLEQKLSFLGVNLLKTLGMFYFQGDLNGRQNYPGKPAVNLMIGTLMIIGLGKIFTEKNTFFHRLFLIYFLISIIPSLLTYPQENPHMLRTFTAIPSVIYFTTFGIIWLLKFVSSKTITYILIIMLVIISATYELRTYFVYQTQIFPWAFEMKKELNYYIKIYQ